MNMVVLMPREKKNVLIPYYNNIALFNRTINNVDLNADIHLINFFLIDLLLKGLL
jgi:hypothetical protein